MDIVAMRSDRPKRSSTRIARDARFAAPRDPRRRGGDDGRAGADASAVLASMPLDPLQVTLIVGPKGGLTIPRAMRSALAIDPGGSLIAQLTPEGVLLRPALTFPMDRCGVREARAALAEERDLDRFLRRRRGRFR